MSFWNTSSSKPHLKGLDEMTESMVADKERLFRESLESDRLAYIAESIKVLHRRINLLMDYLKVEEVTYPQETKIVKIKKPTSKRRR